MYLLLIRSERQADHYDSCHGQTGNLNDGVVGTRKGRVQEHRTGPRRKVNSTKALDLLTYVCMCFFSSNINRKIVM